MSIPSSPALDHVAKPQITCTTSHLRSSVKPWAEWSRIRCASPASLELENMPLDVLLEILKELDWLDVLRLRQVSRTLCSISKEKSVWAAIARKHEDERFPPSHFFEKQVWALTASELEKAFLQPRKVDAAWTSSDISHRVVDAVGAGEVRYCVLPGGRWALTVNDSHGVVYYDLDSPSGSLVPYVLVERPPPAPCYTNRRPLFSVDISSSKGPYLTFNLAVAYFKLETTETPSLPDEDVETHWRQKGWTTTCTSHVQVLRVEPKFGEGGHIIELSSSLLSSFEIGANLADLRLSGPYVGYCPVTHSGKWSPQYCVVEWERANGRGRSFKRRWVNTRVWDKIAKFNFVPGGLVVAFGFVQVELYNINLLPLSTIERRPPTNENTKPAGRLWYRRLDFAFRRYAGPCEVPGGFLFSVLGERDRENLLARAFIVNDGPGPAADFIQPCSIRPFINQFTEHGYDYSKYAQVTGSYTRNHPAMLRHGRLISPPSYSLCETPLNRVQSRDIIIPSNPSDIDNPNGFPMALFHPSFDGLTGRMVVSQTRGPARLPNWVIVSILV